MTVWVGGAQFRMDDARTSPFDIARTVLTFSQTRITNERDKRDNGYQLPQPYNCRTRLFDAMLRGCLFIDAVHPRLPLSALAPGFGCLAQVNLTDPFAQWCSHGGHPYG